MDYRKKYDRLWQFLGAYFHQDWDDEYESLDDAVQDYVTSDRLTIEQCYYELKILLEEIHSEEEWKEVIFLCLSCNYNYSYDGMTARQFLETIQELMRKHAWEMRKIRLD